MLPKRISLSLFILFIALLAVAGYQYYQHAVYNNNVAATSNRTLIIPEGSEYGDVLQRMKDDSLLVDYFSFDKVAQYSGYAERIKPGRYTLRPGMGNKAILRMLVLGKQQQVKVVIRGTTNLFRVLAEVSEQLEADSMELIQLYTDNSYLKQFGWSAETIEASIIPNTYFFYWDTDARTFLKRMLSEYDAFWNKERKDKAEVKGLSPLEVSILASIVDKETSKVDEMPTIAGVYLNRLKKGWKLEADPTVIYAVGNPDIRRVTFAMTEVESPYNTYRVQGLPPGPICLPSVQSIRAVLNARQHEYMYFCAKEDFSGYHNFTKDYQQHLLNSKRYQLELKKRGIR